MTPRLLLSMVLRAGALVLLVTTLAEVPQILPLVDFGEALGIDDRGLWITELLRVGLRALALLGLLLGAGGVARALLPVTGVRTSPLRPWIEAGAACAGIGLLLVFAPYALALDLRPYPEGLPVPSTWQLYLPLLLAGLLVAAPRLGRGLVGRDA